MLGCPGSCWLVGGRRAAPGNSYCHRSDQETLHELGAGGKVCLKQTLQPILTAPSSVEVAWLEAEGRWEVWWHVPFMLVEGKRVCVGKGTEQSPALETQEDVFLTKDKYTGFFPLITQHSIIPECTFFPFAHMWLLLVFLHNSPLWCPYLCG